MSENGLLGHLSAERVGERRLADAETAGAVASRSGDQEPAAGETRASVAETEDDFVGQAATKVTQAFLSQVFNSTIKRNNNSICLLGA